MKKRIFTIPNLLDFLRIVASPLLGWLIIIEWKYTVFVLAAVFATDLFDGYIARNFNQKSELGESLDPIADKIIFLFVLFSILIREELHLWLWIFSILAIFFFILFLVLRP
ncbi:MAG: CDP-alcohol phosphatidyltransferase family protein, partial [Candidatus Cloacimonadota bacterium]|nr:CDP-alcohol phosphatidyltransferase family protein [Candidatus Cloacimonadota bacterium]